MLRVDRFAAHVALASTKNRYYSIAWLRPSFYLSLYCSQWTRRSRDNLETDKTSGRFWVFVSGRFCDRTEEREKLRTAEDLPPKTEGLAPLVIVNNISVYSSEYLYSLTTSCIYISTQIHIRMQGTSFHYTMVHYSVPSRHIGSAQWYPIAYQN